MNNKFIINLLPGSTFLHQLSGTTKVRLFLVMIVFTTMSFDFRLLMLAFLLASVALISLKPAWKSLKWIAWLVVLTNLLNIAMYYAIKPNIGADWCNASTILFQITPFYIVTQETIWYLFVRFFKFITSFLVSIVFILSITPSELAAGLYKLHIPYKVCSVVSLAFRYIPDIARDYTNISISMQCRGVELDGKKASLWSRLKQTVLILVPLVITSFDRIGNIANAMDLRGFGKNKKRSYYCEHEETKNDRMMKFVYIGLLIFEICYIGYTTWHPASTAMWCPFIY